MKTYEDLTKIEKEKLSMYLTYCLNDNIQLAPLMILGIVFSIVGLMAMFIFVIPIIILAGGLTLFVGLYLILATLLVSFRERKRLFLIFGWKDSLTDLFEIKNSDLRRVKIERKVIWHKGD